MNLKSIITKSLSVNEADLDGEVVMMDIEKGEYTAMNAVASSIWNAIKENTTVEDIVDELVGKEGAVLTEEEKADKYDIPREVCEKEVIKFLEKLNEKGLISVRE